MVNLWVSSQESTNLAGMGEAREIEESGVETLNSRYQVQLHQHGHLFYVE